MVTQSRASKKSSPTKMKFAVSVILATFVAISNSAPHTSWQAVYNSVKDTENAFRSALEESRNLANMDDISLKYNIEAQLSNAARRASSLFAQAKDSVRDHVFGSYEAHELVDGIKRILERLQSDIKAMGYSPATTGHIIAVLNRAKGTAERKLDDFNVYTPVYEHRQIDWKAVDDKLQEIIINIHDNFDNVKNVANTDDITIGRNIESHLIDTWFHANNIFRDARDAIRDQYLKNRILDRTFDKIMYLLVSVKNNLQDELYQLSSGAAAEIRAILHYTRSCTDRRFRELFDLVE